MAQRTCDLCQNPAVIHDTSMRAGIVMVRHLCRTHGLKTWRGALPGPENLSKGQTNAVLQSLTASVGKVHRRSDPPPLK